MKYAILGLRLIIIASLLNICHIDASANEPIILNIDGGYPESLDPGLLYDTFSSNLAEQLFVSLVDLDDQTHEFVPDLATNWSTSTDGMVLNFTLRENVYWTDGHEVTAGDVKYAIIRNLTPSTGSSSGYNLSIIRNAYDYYIGETTDPDEIGITALDDHHLQISLEYPASFAISIFSMPVTRPLPQWAIDTWGENWTEPDHIVTNGAYQLSGRFDNYLVLSRNTAYYDNSNTQIDIINWWWAEDMYSMYLNNNLDTVTLPNEANLNNIQIQEVTINSTACTYYYGFNTSQPPFDQPLVRKAFAAATYRSGIVNSAAGQSPAYTYTPPGIFGHVDGLAEGVGIPFNPIQAQKWLAEAGYPNGNGFPHVTLWINEGNWHYSIASYLTNNWKTILGVNVEISTLPWEEYLSRVRTGEFQIWRLGWCPDYPDANNFLNDGIHRQNFGSWQNLTYESLITEAIIVTNPTIRQELYKQAEEILVKTDAVMIPLYYYGSRIATKPYLSRSRYTGYPFDISGWRFTNTSTIITSEGGALTDLAGDTSLVFPPNAFESNVIVTYSPSYGVQPIGELDGIQQVFEINAFDSVTQEMMPLSDGKTYTLTLNYDASKLRIVDEGSLALYYWDGSNWVKEPTSVVDPGTQSVTATPDHFSLWGIFGHTNKIYLPQFYLDLFN